MARRLLDIVALEQELEELNRFISHKEEQPLVHKIHVYPARFLPQIPRAFVTHLTSPGELVLDPMVGAGTTVEVALEEGRRAIGLDINPISPLVAGFLHMACFDTEQDAQLGFYQEVVSKAFDNSEAEGVALPERAEFHNWKLWFRPEVLRELLLLRQYIDRCSDPLVRRFLKLALSRICKPVSNADPRDLFPQRDQENLVRPRENVCTHMLASIDKLRALVEAIPEEAYHSLLGRADVRHLPLRDNSVDLVFFSPPYSYALEYARVHQLSLSVLGMERIPLREHRRQYIGTDKVRSNAELPRAFVQEYHDIIRLVVAKDEKWGRLFSFYLHGMQQLLLECARVVRPDSFVGIVLGNTKLRGSTMAIDRIVMRMAQKLGLELEFKYERPYYRRRLNPKRNRHSARIDADVFVVLRKIA